MSNAANQKQNDRMVTEMARSGQGSSQSVARDPSLTFAAFTPSELRALQVICRDADNDTFAKKLLGDAIARAEAAK